MLDKLNKFDANKKYMFSKEVALKEEIVQNKYNEDAIAKDWIDFADKKVVEVIDEYTAMIKTYPIKDLIICPWWCVEIN